MQKVAENAQELNLKPAILKCDSCGQPISTDTPRHPDLGPSCVDCLARDEQYSRFEDAGYAFAAALIPIFGRDRGLLLEFKDSIDCHLEIRAQELQQSGRVVDTTLEFDRLPDDVEEEVAQKLAALLVGSFSTTFTTRLREELDWAVRGGR